MTDALARDVAAVGRIDAAPKILETVCKVTGMGFAAIARVTEDRWIACAVRDEIGFGLPVGGELEIGTTICDEIRQSGRRVVIDHVAEDQDFCGHPTPAQYGFQSYISVPVYGPSGDFFGTLCAIDPAPAKVSRPEVINAFELFAELIGMHLEASDRAAAREAALRDAEHTAELREQFIAVLGHDLRNPLAALDAGVHLLAKRAADESSREIATAMHKSVRRMSGMISDVLDFARGRLGGGLTLQPQPSVELADVLAEVAAELSAAKPDRRIEIAFALDQPVACDPARIGQLYSNLLANALTHGDPLAPVRTGATLSDGHLELWVANEGPAIPPDTATRLFQPFVRAAGRPGREGLGLGLYIVSEIARAHGGEVEVASDETETRFTFRMPAEAVEAAAPAEAALVAG
jgi:signal transduction histidine kinase